MVFDPTKSPVKLTLADFRKGKRGGWRGGGGRGGEKEVIPLLPPFTKKAPKNPTQIRVKGTDFSCVFRLSLQSFIKKDLANFQFKVTFLKLLPIVLNPSILGYPRFFSTACLTKQILGDHYISQKHILNFSICQPDNLRISKLNTRFLLMFLGVFIFHVFGPNDFQFKYISLLVGLLQYVVSMMLFLFNFIVELCEWMKTIELF